VSGKITRARFTCIVPLHAGTKSCHSLRLKQEECSLQNDFVSLKVDLLTYNHE